MDELENLRAFKEHVNTVLGDALADLRIARDSSKGSMPEQVAALLRASAPAGEEPPKHWRESEEVKAHRAMFHIFYDGDVTHTEVLNHNLDILCDAVAALHSRSPAGEAPPIATESLAWLNVTIRDQQDTLDGEMFGSELLRARVTENLKHLNVIRDYFRRAPAHSPEKSSNV